MTPRKVVLAPDVLIAALYDPRAREILNQWRDSQIVPVVTRELLVLYLRTFNQAGLIPDLIRKWSLWLTTTPRALYLEDPLPTNIASMTGLNLCREVARLHQAELATLNGKIKNLESSR